MLNSSLSMPTSSPSTPTSAIEAYLNKSKRDLSDLHAGFLAYLANLDCVSRVSPESVRAVIDELRSQRTNVKLIASENYTSLATQCAMANLLTDKYAEGVPGARFYSGCESVDAIEAHASSLARQLFGADHAYVQPHSGADANLVAFWAILSKRIELPALEALGVKESTDLSARQWEGVRQQLGNQRLLGMDLSAGGHLTHGFRRNISARMFESRSYGVNPVTGLLDYDEIARIASEFRPLILLAGYSAYPRRINFARMRDIARAVDAVLMVDMAHFAGLVAGGVFEGEFNPIPYADVVTTTTHKTLRGPRGGLVLCTSEFASMVDKGCPLVLGGPLPHVIAAKAVCLAEALKPEFADYARRIVANAQTLAASLMSAGLTVVTGGTDNHLLSVDVSGWGLTGRQAERALRECGITLNRNTIPNDPNGAWYTSGLRLGAPAVTTLGMGRDEMSEIASIMTLVIKNTSAAASSKVNYTLPESVRAEARARVGSLLARYPVYPELDLEFLEDYFASRQRPA
jgi:glycine hydroxymethyltransferase